MVKITKDVLNTCGSHKIGSVCLGHFFCLRFLFFYFTKIETDYFQGLSIDASNWFSVDVFSMQVSKDLSISKKALLKFILLGSKFFVSYDS